MLVVKSRQKLFIIGADPQEALQKPATIRIGTMGVSSEGISTRGGRRNESKQQKERRLRMESRKREEEESAKVTERAAADAKRDIDASMSDNVNTAQGEETEQVSPGTFFYVTLVIALKVRCC